MSTNLQSNYDKSAAYFPLRAIPARPIVRGETDMMEIFLIQLLAAGLGALSTAWADWSYNRAQIGRRLHALWVATSIGVICLPVVSWTSMVFLGSGLLGQLVAGTLVGAVFLWVYRNLPKPRQVRKFGPGFPDARGAAPFPPASRLDG
jgi:hypothetical protein